MLLVIADTSPVNYLILIGHIDILPLMFQRVILPITVRNELRDAPLPVSNWIAEPPQWIDIRETLPVLYASSEELDRGEADAIALAIEIRADLRLMDDRDGTIAARHKGIEVIGTLGILARAAKKNLLDLGTAFENLKRANFRYRQEIMNALLQDETSSQDLRHHS